jgi:hypothetical protein
MAQQRTVRFVDDLDGSEASGTVDFGLDGRRYEIDLSDDNAAKLRDALAPFVGAARKSGGRGSGSRGSVGRATAGRGADGGRGQRRTVTVPEKSAPSAREETAAIRQWAREHGHEVSERGRISKSVLEAYRAS